MRRGPDLIYCSTFQKASVSRLRRAFEGASLIFDLNASVGPGVQLKEAEKSSCNHPGPTSPAINAVKRIDAEIAANRLRRKL